MPSELAFEFDPFELAGVGRPRNKAKAREAMDEIAAFVEEKVIEACGDGRSPVAGGEWKRTLSKAYKKKKTAQGGNSYADMLLDGDMLLATGVVRAGENLKLRTKGSKQAAKADGHNNHSGNSPLPPRDFIPKAGGSFKRDIIRGMREIAEKYADDNETE